MIELKPKLPTDCVELGELISRTRTDGGVPAVNALRAKLLLQEGEHWGVKHWDCAIAYEEADLDESTEAMEVLDRSIDDALAQVQVAATFTDKLAGGLYDEYESDEGRDLQHHLAEAARSLRAARVLHQKLAQ